MGANDPLGPDIANLDPRGMLGKIYKANHDALLHTNGIQRTSNLCLEDDALWNARDLVLLLLPDNSLLQLSEDYAMFEAHGERNSSSRVLS